MGIREKLGRPFHVLQAATANGFSDALDQRGGDGARVIVVASGGATGDFQVEGSHDGTNWYTLGPVVSFAGDGCRTVWVGEPNTQIRIRILNYAAGTFDGYVQRFD